MKAELLYDKVSGKWVLAPSDSLLIDKPFSSLFTSFDNSMLETADGYKLKIAVKGMKKKHLKLEVADGVLTVHGQKQQKDVFGWARKTAEFRSTQIYRTVTLPEDADIDGIKAKCREGLLEISIPKIKKRSTYSGIPVEDTGKMSWWQKISKPFKLKTKVRDIIRDIMRRLAFGSGRGRNLFS
ncbi:Hsp20/alpha crystallin family protein [Pontibacter toksunensis]|uniref:Hsp20/alpha crystallin family protein n=2 Tax=Pontibacter toksunensis TaxID=1332631 RepID=A0ABW6C0K0_9BACT